MLLTKLKNVISILGFLIVPLIANAGVTPGECVRKAEITISGFYRLSRANVGPALAELLVLEIYSNLI